ncbi:MAG: capsular biosynthesis protein CpsE [Desulfobulbus propionicus]|nr:MAG: capsular biosynthesis protein CpsE [Desulfobulbus propionicus]
MAFLLKKYYPVRKIIFFLGEGGLIFAAILLCYVIFSGWQIFRLDLLDNTIRALVVTGIFQICLYFFDLYDLRRTHSPGFTLIRVSQAFGVGCILLALIYFFAPLLVISTTIFWASYVIICLGIAGWRGLYYLVLERRLFTLPVLLVGTGRIATEILQELKEAKDSSFHVLAYIGTSPPTYNPDNLPVYANFQDFQQAHPQRHLERIIVALEKHRDKMFTPELLEYKLAGVSIDDGVSFYEEITGKILVKTVNPAWLIFADGFGGNRLSHMTKRTLDIVVAVTGLIVTLPITLLTALLIKLESPGPVFYTQERVGEKSVPYKVIKFRSMREDAEKHGAVWARQDDPRVTRTGTFIRKARIDEIPQMWNVLLGEMSFVGPRPERPVFVKQLTRTIPYYSLRHAVKPGITGWAQVCYPYGASEEDALHKLEYDLYYIKNRSIFLDLMIIFRTVKTVLFQKGSR